MRRHLLFTLFFIATITPVFSQSILKSFHRLSRPEKMWAIAHPFIAKKSWHCTQRARAVTDSLDKHDVLKDGNGGQLDAFRHAYWMALLTQKISPKKAMKLGKAHERGDYLEWKKGNPEDMARADSMACVMDLKNDSSGIAAGKQFQQNNAPNVRKMSLVFLVLNDVRNGKMVMLKKDASGNFVDCDGKVIDLRKYSGKWYIPKCLVSSDN